MRPAGTAVMERAKENGSWSAADEVEALIMPKDLEAAFKKHRGSKAFFGGLSKSVRKAMLQWVMQAKRPDTREKRIAAIAEQAAQQKRPPQF